MTDVCDRPNYIDGIAVIPEWSRRPMDGDCTHALINHCFLVDAMVLCIIMFCTH